MPFKYAAKFGNVICNLYSSYNDSRKKYKDTHAYNSQKITIHWNEIMKEIIAKKGEDNVIIT